MDNPAKYSTSYSSTSITFVLSDTKICNKQYFNNITSSGFFNMKDKYQLGI